MADLQRNPNDHSLREKIIKLALEIKLSPAIPDEAERHFFRGAAFIKDAKDVNDFKAAVAELEKAVLLAPWFADAYYNLAIAQSKAGDYSGAARSLRLYLLAAPDASDTRQAKALMYEMEVKAEKAEKEKSQRQADAERETLRKQAEQQSLEGRWYWRHGGSEAFVIHRDTLGQLTMTVTGHFCHPGSSRDVRINETRIIFQLDDGDGAHYSCELALTPDGSELRGIRKVRAIPGVRSRYGRVIEYDEELKYYRR